MMSRLIHHSVVGAPSSRILSPLAAGFMKKITERSMFRSVFFFSWQSLVPPSDLPLKRTMDIREPSFDETGAQNAIFRSDFLYIANKPIDFAPRRASNGP